MADSRRAHAKEYFPELLLPISFSPRWATATPAFSGDPPTLTGRSGSVFYGVTAPFCWVLMCTLLCVYPPRVGSVSPSPAKVLQSNPASLQSLILWEFLLPLLDPQVGNPDIGLRTFSAVVGLLWYYCSPVWESPAVVMGFDFIVIASLLPSHCGFSFVCGCGVSFLLSSSVFLSMIVQQLFV